ncbi:MAG: hypothetical protein LBQ64_05635 [Bacteroidales bacterium]|jgi:hypothetical protein|nr:hypothetical protein [Bacteroidales bacterium]
MKKNNKKKENPNEKVVRFINHKITTIILLSIVSIVYFSNYAAIFDKKLNLNGDNIYYFTCGKAIAEGKGYTSVMSFEETPQTHFPPGYSMFIAVLQKIAPDNIVFVKIVNGVLLWLSILLLFWLVKKIAKNTLVAFCTALFTAIQAGILSFATMMMSEILFLFISLTAIHLAIILNEKLFKKKGGWKFIVLLVLLMLNIACIYFVRTMGISLILTLGLWYGILTIQSFFHWLKEKKKTTDKIQSTTQNLLLQRIIICLLIGASFLTAHASWSVRQANAGQAGSSYKAMFLMKQDGQTMSTYDDWKTRITTNVSENITRYVPETLFATRYNSDETKTTGDWIAGLLMIVVFIFGLFFLNKQTFWIIFLYVGATMLVLIFYPEQFQGSRYLTPIIPFFIFLFFNGIVNIITVICKYIKRRNSFIPQVIVLFICTCVMYPRHITAQTELRAVAKVQSWTLMPDMRMNQYLTACMFCKDNLPDSIRVICRKPEIFYMFSGYKKANGFPQYADPDTVMSFLRENNATHLIIDTWYKHAYATLYPAVRKYPEKFKILQEYGKMDIANKQYPTYLLEFNDEWGYHGDLVNGLKTGEGYELFQDGGKYVGHYENNLFNGYGIYYNKEGKEVYKGYWKDGIFSSSR